MKRHTFLQKQGNIQKDKNRPDEKKGKKERKNAEMQAVRKARKNNSPRMKRHTFLQKQGNIQKDKNRPDEKKGKKERKNAENEEGAKSQISETALTMTRFFNSFRLNLTRKLKRNGWNRKNSIHPPNEMKKEQSPKYPKPL